MQALSNDLKHIQLFCAREKPLLANLIIKIVYLFIFFFFIETRVWIEQQRIGNVTEISLDKTTLMLASNHESFHCDICMLM